MNVRIEFIKEGKTVKTFDREARNIEAANKLADQIAIDSGIQHDKRIIWEERKFQARIFNGDIRIETIESKAFDEAHAAIIARRWARDANKDCTDVKVQFLEA